MVVADAVVDEPAAPVAARSGSGPGRADRVRIVAHLTALHIGRDAGGRTVDATLRLPAPVPVVVFASGVDEQHDDPLPLARGSARSCT